MEGRDRRWRGAIAGRGERPPPHTHNPNDTPFSPRGRLRAARGRRAGDGSPSAAAVEWDGQVDETAWFDD